MNHPARFLMPVLCAGLLAACGGGDDDSLDDRLGTADPKVRLLHAVPLAPSVQLLRGGQSVAPEADDVSYKEATRYFDVATGGDTWKVQTVGATPLEVGTLNFDAQRGKKFTIVAMPNAGSVTEALLVVDPFTKSLASDNARLRFLNGSFNASGIDVYVTAPGADLATQTPKMPAVAYKSASPASGEDSTEVEGANYQIRLTPAGSKTPFFSATVNLSTNADWLLTTVPASPAPNDVKLLVVKSDEGAPAVELTNQLP